MVRSPVGSGMARLSFEIADEEYVADLHEAAAPETAARIRDLLPLTSTIRHVIWSGHAAFIHEFGEDAPEFADLPRERPEVYPSRGDVLLYPGYDAPAELLLACGETCLNDPYGGEMAGNHVATLRADPERLRELDEWLVETGAKDVVVRER